MSTVGPARPPRADHIRGRLRDWAARRPVTAFLVLTLSGAYPLVEVCGLAYYGVPPGGSAHEWLHIDRDEVAGLALTHRCSSPPCTWHGPPTGMPASAACCGA